MPTATPPPTSANTPTATPTAVSSGVADARIACAFHDGIVPFRESDEYVEFVDLGNAAQDMQGWKLIDIADAILASDFPTWRLGRG